MKKGIMLIGKNQHNPFSYGFLNRKKQRESARKKGGRKPLQQGPNESVTYRICLAPVAVT